MEYTVGDDGAAPDINLFNYYIIIIINYYTSDAHLLQLHL